MLTSIKINYSWRNSAKYYQSLCFKKDAQSYNVQIAQQSELTKNKELKVSS